MTKKPDDRHRCQSCGVQHRNPKSYRVLITLAWCVVLTVVQVIAAFALDGWLAWAVWAIAARNVLIAMMLIIGLAGALDESNAEAVR